MTNRREFLTGLAAGPLFVPSSAGATGPLPPLLSKPRLGAEFFLNNSETHDSVFRHFRLMAETGLTIARIFTIWDQIEHEQGKWDFTRYDWIYDAAAQNGILIANTLCSEDPPGWMGTAPFYHQWADLSNPRLRPVLRKLHRESRRLTIKIIPRMVSGCCRTSRASAATSTSPMSWPNMLAGWRRSTARSTNLNKAWYRQLHRFEEARAPESGGWVGLRRHS